MKYQTINYVKPNHRKVGAAIRVSRREMKAALKLTPITKLSLEMEAAADRETDRFLHLHEAGL